MRGLYKRGGKWYCSIVDARGKLIRKPLATDKQTAANILADMRKNIDLQKSGIIPIADVAGKQATSATTMDEIRRKYERHLATLGRSETFQTGFGVAWNSIFVHGGFQSLDQFDLNALDKWIQKRLTEVKPQSLNVYLSAMKGFYGWAVREGYTTQNPLDEWNQLRAADKNFRRDLTAEEVRRILDSETNPTDRLLWMVYFFTGLRRAAGAALAWEWIDWDKEVITLPVRNNKSGRSHRIPLHPALAEALRQYQGGTGARSGRVFPRVSAKTILIRFKAACCRAGVDLKGVCLHSIRHTFASRVYENSGRNLKAVQEMLGHTSLNTTALYLHVDDAIKRDAVSKLDY